MFIIVELETIFHNRCAGTLIIYHKNYFLLRYSICYNSQVRECDSDEVHLEIFTDLYVFGPPGYGKVVSIMLYTYVCMYVCKYVFMCASLVPEWLDRFCSYSIFKSLSVLGRCSANLNFPATEKAVLHMGAKIQKC